MKPQILKLALVLAGLLSTPAAASDAPNAHLNLLGNTFMNLRSCPATTASCPAMLEMPDNAPVTIILDRGDWTRIGVTGSDGKYYEGFVKSKFVEQGGAPAAPAPQAATPAPAPAATGQSTFWQESHNNCLKTDLTEGLTSKQAENFCSCVASSTETVRNGSNNTKEQKLEQLKPMIMACARNAVAAVDTPSAPAPAAANDCLDEQRQWQREDTEIQALLSPDPNSPTRGADLLSNTRSTMCSSGGVLDRQIRMLRHKAAFYRHCHPDLQGEDTAHEADLSRVTLERTCSR